MALIAAALMAGTVLPNTAGSAQALSARAESDIHKKFIDNLATCSGFFTISAMHALGAGDEMHAITMSSRASIIMNYAEAFAYDIKTARAILGLTAINMLAELSGSFGGGGSGKTFPALTKST